MNRYRQQVPDIAIALRQRGLAGHAADLVSDDDGEEEKAAQ